MKEWIKAAGMRAIKTFAQAAIAAIGTSYAMEEVNWIQIASISLLATVFSILTSIAGLPEVENNKGE
jgi:hypothetical protein